MRVLLERYQEQVKVSVQQRQHAQRENIEQQVIVLHVHKVHIAQEEAIQQDTIALMEQHQGQTQRA